MVTSPFSHRVPEDIAGNLRYRANLHKKVIDDPSLAEVLWDACAVDPIFYANAFCYTYDTRCEPFSKIPFILYPFQKEGLLEIINAMNEEDLLIKKARDMGASWLCILAFEWVWHFKIMKSLLMVSRNADYVDYAENPKSLFWKIDFLHEHLPVWMMPPGYKRSSHRRKSHITNPYTGSVIDGEATTQDVARGDRRYAILLDEFAAVEQGTKVLAATQFATNSRIFNSTPKGVANAYYDTHQTAIKKLIFDWPSHPDRSPGLYTTDKDGKLEVLIADGYPEDYAPILDGKIRSPWYDLACARSPSNRLIAQELDMDFLGSGHQFFLADSILEATRKFARPPVATGDLGYDGATGDPMEFREHENGMLRLWRLLGSDGKISLEHKYVLGCDVSAGTGSSNSVLAAYDSTTNEKVLEYANPYIRPEEFARQAVAIARWLGGAYVIWESNGPGRAFGSRISDLKYSSVFLRRQEDTLSKKVSQIPGWPSTKDSKLVLVGDYRDAIEKSQCVNRSREALQECLEYIFDPLGGVSHSREANREDPTGARDNHGDRVIADALAWKGLKSKRARPDRPKQEIPIGSLAWRNEQRAKMKREKEEKKDGWYN